MILKSIAKLILACICVFALTCQSEKQVDLKVGDPAPSFQANDQDGNLWRSKDHLQGYLVVYFYPAAMTGGCTKQACGFRDGKPALDDYDVEVVGISGDAVKNLKIFKKAHDLNFTLLSDVSGDISTKFGVPTREGKSIKKEIAGEEVTLSRAITTARWTFIIDDVGKIAYKNTEVTAAEDSKSVLEFLREAARERGNAP